MNTVHDVITDIMLALARYHSVESVLAGDGSHSTDQPSGRGQGHGVTNAGSSGRLPEVNQQKQG
jgi:hypothetical protein